MRRGHKGRCAIREKVKATGAVLEGKLNDLGLHREHGLELGEFGTENPYIIFAVTMGVASLGHALPQFLDAAALFHHATGVEDHVLGISELEPVARDVHPHCGQECRYQENCG